LVNPHRGFKYAVLYLTEDFPPVFRKLQKIHLSDPERDEEGLRKIAQVLKEAA
jgi:hypothetical protein